MSEIKSTCCYCGVGCGVIIQTDDAGITGVRGDPGHPANFGRLCTKGASLHLSAGVAGRVMYPEARAPARSGPRLRVSWEHALDLCAQEFAAIIRAHGPNAVAFYVSGQLLTEDYYIFNKLAKGLIGTNNIDTNSRLCMSSAVAGYKATLGADAPPPCYEDIDFAHCLFIAGSNTAFAHPVLYRRIDDARRNNPDLKVIVVDPRRTDTAQEATLHLAILPGTDVALFNAMLHVLLWDGLVNRTFVERYTEGFDAVKNAVRECTPTQSASICGVPAADIVTAAHWFSQCGPTLSLYCQGLNQSSNGTQNNAALINLHLATGQIAKRGAGPLSLTGQPNAMGGREVGGMATLMSAHRDLGNSNHRAELAQFWGVPQVPAIAGKTAVELFDALDRGDVKAVWIACTNPAQSMPNASFVQQALQKTQFVVVQEAFANADTVAYADVLLPASTWGEKDGVVTNSERRITRVRPAVAAPGEARADWQIARDFALKLGAALGHDNAPELFPYTTAEDIFNEHRDSTRARDLDITGLSYALLDTLGPQQWPFPIGATQGTARLYQNHRFATPNGRARFVATTYSPSRERTDSRFPLHFNTGRLRDQWHGMSRTGRVARLYNHAQEPVLAMNRRDMERRQLIDADIVRARTRRGRIILRVAGCEQLRPGQTFLPMHWSGQSMNSSGANVLTLSAFDPISKQPELKHAALQVEKLDLPWQMVVMRASRNPRSDDEALALLAKARSMLHRFTYATLGMFGHDIPAVILRAAHEEAASDSLIGELDELFALHDSCSLTYRDARRGISKRVMLEHGRVVGVRLTGETAARDWLKDVMAQGASNEAVRRWVLAPLSTPPVGSDQRGRIVCTCVNVAQTEILAKIQNGADLSALQQALRCGTQCGSCLPELKQLIASHARTAA